MEAESAIYQSFGEFLRAYRKRKRMTQKQLAELLGVHANTVSSWELGTYLPQTRGLIVELAQHLGLADQETRQLLEAGLFLPVTQPELPPAPSPVVSSEPEQDELPTKVWEPDAGPHTHPPLPLADVPLPPGSCSYLPLVKNWSVRKQIRWMVGYTLLALSCWVPCVLCVFIVVIMEGANSTIPPFIVVYFPILCLLLVPASVLFAGAIFGVWRGGLVAACYTAIIASPVVLALLFSSRAASMVISSVVLFCSWPLAALVTGWLYQQHLFRDFGKAYVTILPGMVIMLIGGVLPLLAAGPSSDLNAATYNTIVLLLFVPALALLLALPLAVIEVITQRTIEKKRKSPGVQLH